MVSRVGGSSGHVPKIYVSERLPGFADSGLGLATLRLSTLGCLTLHTKRSLEGREEGKLDELSPQP